MLRVTYHHYEISLMMHVTNFVVDRWWEELVLTSRFFWHLFTTSPHGFFLQFSKQYRCFQCLLHLKQLLSLLYLHLALLWLLHPVLQTPASSITGSWSCSNMFISQNCIGFLYLKSFFMIKDSKFPFLFSDSSVHAVLVSTKWPRLLLLQQLFWQSSYFLRKPFLRKRS